jgi:predicted acetyltransferase
METFEYDRVRDAEELAVHARNMAWSFHFDEAGILESLGRVGQEHVRVLRRDGATIGGLTLYPLAQYIGGRSVPMIGVNLVGMEPQHRGGGAATFLMEQAVREMAERAPISALYPAKQTVYRRVGYELAGVRWEHQAPLTGLGSGSRDGGVREIAAGGLDEVKRLHARRVAGSTGPLDRPDFMWQRIADPVRRKVRGFLLDGEREPEGYVFVEEKDGEGLRHDLLLLDVVVLTAAAARRLARFLADHGSLARHVTWHGDARDPFLFALPEQTWQTRAFFRWMLRVLDLPAALEARGYPSGITAAVDLHVDDPLLERNTGNWRLAVEGGRGHVERGGRASARLSVRGLASLFTGFASADALQAGGLLEADADTRAMLDRIFPLGDPWMSEMF